MRHPCIRLRAGPIVFDKHYLWHTYFFHRLSLLIEMTHSNDFCRAQMRLLFQKDLCKMVFRRKSTAFSAGTLQNAPDARN